MTTPLESLAEALLSCRAFASGAEAAPEAIIWCDPGAEFTPIMPVLRVRLPHLLTSGAAAGFSRECWPVYSGSAPLVRDRFW